MLLLSRPPKIEVPVLDVPVDSLLTIERDVWADRLANLGDPVQFDPGEAVVHLPSMEHGVPTRFILVDGAHRAFTRARRGYDTVRVRAATQDRHLRRLGSPAVSSFRTIAEVNERYERHWRHSVPPGLQSIADLPIADHTRF